MEHVSTRTTSKGPADWFTGDVYVDPITQGQGATPMSVASVHFTLCAHTAWHDHTIGQTLCVAEGVGYVQARGGPLIAIRAGDVIRVPGGEEHWHGGAPTNFMTTSTSLKATPCGATSSPTTSTPPADTQQAPRQETTVILEQTYTLSNGVRIPKLGLGTWFIDNDGTAEAVRQAAAIGYRQSTPPRPTATKRAWGRGSGPAVCRATRCSSPASSPPSSRRTNERRRRSTSH
jgi:quercetin dioxygenase-like cupin family protein